MANTMKQALAGGVAQNSSNNTDDAEHVAHRILTFGFTDFDAAGAYEWLVHVAQAPMTLTEAYIVPSVTQGTDATNYVTLTLGKGDLANTAITSFDAVTTNSSGGAALTISTKRSFTIDQSTDTLAKGDGLYLHLAHAASTMGEIAGTLVVHYKLQG